MSKHISGKVFTITLLLIIVIWSILTSLNGGDFDIYLEAAKKLRLGMDPYSPPFMKNLGYSYSPFFAVALIPFSYNFFISEVIWSILSFLMFYRSFILIKRYFDFSIFTSSQYNTWLLLLAFLSLQFVVYNVSMIQVTFLILWAIFESLNLIFKGRNTLGGILLGIVINIKIMPVLILAYLFYRGYFKAFSSAIITSIALLFFPTIFFGIDYNLFLLSGWWGVINPANPEHVIEAGIGTHSITAFLPVFLTETKGELSYKRDIFHLSFQQAIYATYIMRILLIALSLLLFRSLPFKKESSLLKTYWEISYFVMLIPLILPHQQKYGFLLVLPMIAYILYYFIVLKSRSKLKNNKIGLIAFIIAMLFFSPIYGSDILGWNLFQITQHYRLLTFATLTLMIISIYYRPDKLETYNFKLAY